MDNSTDERGGLRSPLQMQSEASKYEIEQAVRSILRALGEDTEREGLRDTPSRVAKMYLELFAGLGEDASHHFDTQFGIEHSECCDESGLILVSKIQFFSMCEHHLLPFFGQAHIAYLPSGSRVAGLSKFARVVEALARRPQMQERLTAAIADIVETKLEPRGVLVLLEAEHMCMSMRGVRSQQAVTSTLEARGLFQSDAVRRSEVLTLIRASYAR